MIKLGFIRMLLLVGGLLLSLYACAPLPAPHTYYVSTTGNDSNDCLSAAHACRTLDAAVSKATPQSQIDVGAGTFPTNVTLTKWPTIVGAGSSQTTLSATSPTSTVITLPNTAHASITELTISGGMDGVNLVGNSVETQVLLNNVIISNAVNGVLAGSSAVTLVGDTISNNTVGVTTFGGGTLNISQSSFQGNDIALLNTSVAILDHVSVDSSNVPLAGSYGAAVDNITEGGASGRMTISNSSVSNNTGGGIENQGGPVTVSSSQFLNNTQGGIENSGMIAIGNSVIADNERYGISSGGNMQITQDAVIHNGFAPVVPPLLTNVGGVEVSSGTVSIVNSTISGNNAAGLYNQGGNVSLSYDTVVYNNYGVANFQSAVAGSLSTTVQNSIIALNTSTNCPPSISSVTVDTASLACNDSLRDPALGVAPLTADAGTWVNALVAGSPAIDRAIGSCPAVDQRGYYRPVGPACDVGAYEFGSGEHLTAATAVTTTPTLPILQILTFTPSPTVTETPTAAAAPQLTFLLNANCRKGPGPAYDVTTSLIQGQTVDAAGRTSDSSWWLVNIPTGGTCWVGDSTVSKLGPVDQLSIVAAPPLPGTPSKFVNTNVCDLKLKKLTVDLNWATVAGATGYNLYRDGSLLTAVGSGTTTYVDTPPLGAAWTYAVEALNSYGHSDQVTTSVPACK